MIVSVIHVDVRAAVRNVLMRREFSGEGMVMCGGHTGAADVGGYVVEVAAKSLQEEVPQPSPSKILREHVVASGMILLVSANLTMKVD